MPKFRVSADEHLYYLSKEIKAKTAEEATDIYLKMIDNGQVEVNESNLQNLNAKEII